MNKEQLKAYRYIKIERDCIAEMIAELEGVMYNPRSQRLDGMPRNGSGAGNEVEAVAVKRMELLERFRRTEEECSTAIVEIEKAIEILPPRERTLIRLHYIEGLTWEEVCATMNYSWRQVHRIHAKALVALESTV